MPGPRAGLNHRMVMGLEPSRGAATVLYGFVTLALYELPNLAVFPRDVAVTVWFLVVLTLSALAFVVNARRWYAYRVVLWMSRDPRLAALLPPVSAPTSGRRAPPQPRPHVAWWVGVPRGGTGARPRRVTPHANVLGRPPLNIVYLRVFENRPRTRNFARGAWREFGYVHMLRSAAAVPPRDVRKLRRPQRYPYGLVTKAEEMAPHLAAPRYVQRSGFRYLDSIAGSSVLTFDRYGSYSMVDPLCRGDFWQAGLDMLLVTADLVVLDLSGFSSRFAGTQFELQHIVDTVPVRKVLLVADPRSRRSFLDAQVAAAWDRMAVGSPNVGAPREIQAAVTDYFRQVVQRQGDSTYVRWVLRPSRGQVRRLMEHVQWRLEDPRVRAIESPYRVPLGRLAALAATVVLAVVAFPLAGRLLPGQAAAVLNAQGVPFVAPAVSASAPPQTVELVNVGRRALHVDGASTEGPHAADFTVTGWTCAGAIPEYGSCRMTVAFTPADVGTRTAFLRVIVRELPTVLFAPLTGTIGPGPGSGSVTPSPTGGTSPTGETTQPVATLVATPETLAFGARVVGVPGDPKPVRVAVSGATTTLDRIRIAPPKVEDFTIDPNSCSRAPLKPGFPCTIDIRFTPRALGARTARLIISPAVTVGLEGEGRRPTTTVPKVEGDPLPVARLALGKANLEVEADKKEPSSTYPKGVVIRSDPKAGETVDVDSTVRLTVSCGPPIPQGLPGSAPAAAQQLVREVGLAVEKFTQMPSATTPKGLVIGSKPKGGACAEPGTAVVLVVSSGPP